MIQPKDVCEGQKVRATINNQTVDAVIALASSNGCSVTLEFPKRTQIKFSHGIRVQGVMLLFWDDKESKYVDMVASETVALESAES